QPNPTTHREKATFSFAFMRLTATLSTRPSATFDSYKFTYDGVGAWAARDLQRLLGDDTWRNFRHAIQRAMDSCRTAGRDPTRHFVPVPDGKPVISPERILVEAGKKSGRGQPREDMILSRFIAGKTWYFSADGIKSGRSGASFAAPQRRPDALGDFGPCERLGGCAVRRSARL
ncbi:MAG: hypothetical protein ACREC6_15350, partial [Hyphomicrobiaceae bacterium]